MTGLAERAAGALYGLAVGDALGMPTESLPRPEIVARYGPLLAEFQPGPPDQPLAAGLPAGTVTDDTEQALLLAELIIEGDGAVDEAEFARRLLAWEEDMRARGSLSLLGSTPFKTSGLGAFDARLSPDEIVVVSQVVGFVSFQIRVAVALDLIGTSAGEAA